jgi:hypothetical protein
MLDNLTGCNPAGVRPIPWHQLLEPGAARGQTSGTSSLTSSTQIRAVRSFGEKRPERGNFGSNLRSGAAPFRSLGRISVTPRPYQFVPLIMALRLDPVRLLIADAGSH